MAKKSKKNRKPKQDDFVHLHMHSDCSQLDGCGRIPEYVAEAVRRKNPAVAFTDHGTMRGYMQLHDATKGQPIKPIYGVEFYMARDMNRKGVTPEEREDLLKDRPKPEHKALLKDFEAREGIREFRHLNVWAKNNIGLRNLYRLSSDSFINGFYYKPRIDMEALIENKEGLIVSTGCLSSPINDHWNEGREREALDYADRLHEEFGEDLCLEVMPHAIREQRDTNKLMIQLRDRYGGKSKLLATQDAHYVKRSDAPHHEILLCIGTGTNINDPDRFKFDGDEFHMRTRREMKDAFKRHHEFIPSQLLKESLDRTMEIAEGITAQPDIDYHAVKLPDSGIPDKYKGNAYDYMKALCLDGWAWRDVRRRARDYSVRHGITHGQAFKLYVDRLKHEMKALIAQKFVPYFLIIHDLYRFARDANIMCGPGRGSVGGSLVAYLLGITAVDPIEHGLIFERFINPHRIDMPDVDMDFEDRRRGEVFEYLIQKYGRDYVAQIATIGKLSGKQVLKDVSRVLEVPYADVNAVTNSIIERSSGDERASQTVADSFKDFEVCREFDRKYPKVLHHAKRLEGLGKTLGIHAAGVVTSPTPLRDLLPLEIRKHDGRDVIVTALDMYGVAAVGLVKLDVLGLKTLTVIKECLGAIEEEHGVKLDLESEDFDLNDALTLQKFTDHDYGGVFQYDTASADKCCMGVNFDSFEDIAAMTALNRPGTSRSGLASEFVKRKKNPKLAAKVHFHPKVSEITKDTLGIIVYQEHVIRIFTDCAGFAPGTADSLRKTIAKKAGDETIGKERENFVKGCWDHSRIDAKTANKIMDAITFFGSYGFNKSHATEYGLIAYWCMWLKTYYPIEFYWALLKNEPDRIRIASLAKDAKKHNIKLLPPHVNVSRAAFSLDRKAVAIRGSLVDIKGVGEKAAEAVMEHAPYKDMADFLERVDRRRCHKGVILSLVKSGSFKGLLPSTKWFVDNVEDFWKLVGKKNFDSARQALEDAEGEEDYSKDDAALIASAVNPLAFGKHPIDAYKSFFKQHVRVKFQAMSDEDFFKDHNNKGVYIAGVTVEVKYNQIGDFHTGAMPSEAERKRDFWGSRYANVNIEDAGGKQNRTKFDIDIFDRCRPVIDLGVGAPMIVHVTPNARFENLTAHFAVDVAEMRRKTKAGEPMNVWESIVNGKHPATAYPWKDEATRKARISNKGFRSSRGGGIFTGVVTNIRLKYDKNTNLMAFFGLLGADGTFIEVIAFTSVWVQVRRSVRVGRLIRCEIEKQPDRQRGGWAHFCGNRVKLLKQPEAESAAAAAAE